MAAPRRNQIRSTKVRLLHKYWQNDHTKFASKKYINIFDIFRPKFPRFGPPLKDHTLHLPQESFS